MAFTERELQDLSDELVKFTEGMKDFTSKGGFKGSTGQPETGDKAAKSFDKGTDKIVNALGLLSAQLTKKDRTEAQQTKYLDNFNKEVEKATEIQKKAKEQDEKLIAQDKEMQQHLEKVKAWADKTFDEQKKELREKKDLEKKELQEKRDLEKKEKQNKDIEGATSRKRASATTQALMSASTAGDVFSSKLSDASTLTQLSVKGLGAVVEGVTAGLTSFSSAIYKGERGTIVAAKAMSATASPILSLIKNIGMAVAAVGAFIPGIGTIGAIIGGLVATAAKAVETYLKFNELGAEQTDKLLKSYNALSKSGLSTAGGMDDVYKRLHALGMSVSEVENFTKLLTSSSKDLALMGKSASAGATEFTEVGKEIVGSDLGKSLRMMGITADEQREAALLYMSIQAKTGQLQGKNAAELAKGTGNLLKEMDALAQLTGTSVEEQKKIQEMSTAEDQFMAAMDDAVASGDQEAIRRLKNYEKAAKLAASVGDQEGAKGLLQQGASPYSTDIGMKAAQTYLGGNALGGEKEMTDEEILKTVRSGMTSQRDRFSGVSRHLEGGIKGTGMSTVGSAQLSKQIRMLEGKSYDDITKGQAAREAQGGRTEAAVEAGRQMERAAQIQDAAVFEFNKAAQISKAGSTAFANAVDHFAEVVGVESSVFSPVRLEKNKKATQAYDASNEFSGMSDDAGASSPAPSPSPAAKTSSAKPTRDGGLLDPRLAGLNVKVGDVHKEGAKLDDRIPALAQKIQAEVAGFERFTGFNDAHTRGKNSKHPQGKALDFTLGYHPTAEQGAEIVNQLKGIGFDYALDEYNNPSSRATAPHIHAQVARTGGIFRGPSTGYNVELHGDEAVVPMNEGVSKQALNTSVFNQDTSMIGDLMDMFQTMQYKYDQMIDLLGRQADNGDKLVLAAY